MGKNVGLTYGEFKFPAEQGFTGSAGVDQVKGYMRGGHVKKTGTANAKHGGYKHGGKMEYAEGGKFGKPGDKYPTLKSGPRGKQGKTMPKNVKKHGGSVHDKLLHEGGKMGYAHGGQVKDTSDEFVAKRGKQKTMDYGNQPARRGRTQQEIEAGGTKRLQPKLAKGGVIKGPKKGVHRVRSLISKDVTKKLGVLKGSMSDAERRYMSKKGMPKNVKAKGGLMEYAHGGSARKPYTGYNKQPGGSELEDARYMQGKK